MLIAAIGLAVVTTNGMPASGDPVGDARAQADRIAARVSELQDHIEVVAEHRNDAQLELAQVQADIQTAQAQADAAQASLTERQAAVREYAVAAYMRGGGTEVDAVLDASDGTEVGERRSYLAAATGDADSAIDALHTAQDDVAVQLATLGDHQDQAAAIVDSLASQEQDLRSSASEQRSLLANANAEVAHLVAVQQAAVAAQQAADASARARAAAASRGTTARTGARTGTGSAPGSGSTAGTDSGSTSVSRNGGADGAVAEALRHVGQPYVWGAAGPSSFDCSGLTSYAWRVGGGVSLPHSAAAQYAGTTHIPMSAIQPGDLIFYGSPVHHVALYIGGGQIVHAPGEGRNVRIDSVYYWSQLVGAGRVN